MAEFNLSTATIESIKQLLDKYIINNSIDEDGEIRVLGSISLFIAINDDKQVIRFYTIVTTGYLDASEEDIKIFTERSNLASNSVKYSFENKEGGIYSEYGLYKAGTVSEEFFIQTLKGVITEIQEMKFLFPLMKKIISK